MFCAKRVMSDLTGSRYDVWIYYACIDARQGPFQQLCVFC
jgi:hypothetical protein